MDKLRFIRFLLTTSNICFVSGRVGREGGHSVQCRSLCCGKMSITLLQSGGGGGGTLPDLISLTMINADSHENSLLSTELSSLYSFQH